MVRVAPVHRTCLEIKAWAHGDGVGRPIQGLGNVMDPGQHNSAATTASCDAPLGLERQVAPPHRSTS